ncbi:MAG: bromoperoxidase, partial [Bacteroidota bacterium]
MTPEQLRRKTSFEVRVEAAKLAEGRTYSYRKVSPIEGQELSQPVIHLAHGDENINHVPVSFTKGLPHNENTGLVSSDADFDQFVKGIDSGDPLDFKRTPLGPSADLNNPIKMTEPDDWKSSRAQDLLKKRRKENLNSDIVRAWESESSGLAFDLEGPDAQAVTMPPAPNLGSAELTAEMAEVYMQAFLRDLPFTDFNAGN